MYTSKDIMSFLRTVSSDVEGSITREGGSVAMRVAEHIATSLVVAGMSRRWAEISAMRMDFSTLTPKITKESDIIEMQEILGKVAASVYREAKKTTAFSDEAIAEVFYDFITFS